MIEIEIIQEELIDVTVENEIEVEVVIPETEVILKEAPKYKGSYEATPEMHQQVFTTKDKLMTNDFTVRGVPIGEIRDGDSYILVIGERNYE